jgi:hypothetical protein
MSHFHEIFVVPRSVHGIMIDWSYIHFLNTLTINHRRYIHTAVNRDTRDTIIVVIVAMATVGVAFSGMFVYSGVWPPFSVVESGSMQHSERSELGIIDTGDMVIVRTMDKNDTVVSYVEGYVKDYSRFGEYGDVIIYERGGGRNPVIHRPIVWLDYNPVTEGWAAPTLADYPYWYVVGVPEHELNPMNISGILVIYNVGFSNKEVFLNLNKDSPLTKTEKSGYATMGDSVGNNTFDQNGGIVDTFVSMDMIKYTAGLEIPWIGSLKLLITGKNVEQIPPNSIPCIIVCAIALVNALVVLFAFLYWFDARNRYDDENDDENDNEEVNERTEENGDEAPHPSVSIGEWLKEDSSRSSDEIKEPDKGE